MVTQSIYFEITGQHAHWLFEYCKKNDTEPQAVLERFLENLGNAGKEKGDLPQALTDKPKRRQAGALTKLTGKTIDVDDSVWFEPMSDEELAWWNGDKTDKYGISL